jgi:hypothetical protein
MPTATPSTKRREVVTALTSAKAEAKRELISRHRDEYDEIVDERMKRHGYSRQQQVIVDWTRVQNGHSG